MIFCNTFLYLLQLSEITGSFRGQVFPALKFLGYSLAGVIGLIGAIRIYNLWNVNGRHHVHIDAQVIAEMYLEKEYPERDTNKSLANRLVTKLAKVYMIKNDYTPYIKNIMYALVAFFIPDLAILFQLHLMKGKKDWEILHCLISYSVVASLPPKTPEAVLQGMSEVSVIYSDLIEEFRVELAKGSLDDSKIEEIIDTVEDNDMQQILETLVVASEIGIDETVENIDDQLANKMEWMAINSTVRREIKTSMSFAFVVIIFLSLFDYLMYHMNMLNNMLFIEF